MFFGDINTVEVSPPSTQANSKADLKSASTNVPSVPSVGAATTPAENPAVVPVVLPVGITRFVIQDSTPAVVRAVPAPPALDAWLRTIAYSMSRLSSLPAFIS